MTITKAEMVKMLRAAGFDKKFIAFTVKFTPDTVALDDVRAITGGV